MQENHVRIAVVTGITGQDGAYLARLLIDKGYRVIGAYRRSSSTNLWRLNELRLLQEPNFVMAELDLTDLSSCITLIEKNKPVELYNLAAQSFVGTSFTQPNTTAQITGIGALNLLEAIRIVDRGIKFYQASTSEMFGLAQAVPQNEETGFYPRSPYGTSKLFAHWTTINYRESYGIFAASGILFNHESPLRGDEFVTRKITTSVAAFHHGSNKVLELGNLEAQRDWGYAPEYVEGMWRMLQTDEPGTYVLATNKATSVREFVALSFGAAGIEVKFEGRGIDEVGIDSSSGEVLVRVNPKHFRPAEVDLLIGDSQKANRVLGWEGRTTAEELAAIMVKADIDRQSNAS